MNNHKNNNLDILFYLSEINAREQDNNKNIEWMRQQKKSFDIIKHNQQCDKIKNIVSCGGYCRWKKYGNKTNKTIDENIGGGRCQSIFQEHPECAGMKPHFNWMITGCHHVNGVGQNVTKRDWVGICLPRKRLTPQHKNTIYCCLPAQGKNGEWITDISMEKSKRK